MRGVTAMARRLVAEQRLADAPRRPTATAAARRQAAAACWPSVLNSWPMKPSGVQLARPMRPPGRHTRAISAADFAWSGANITPKVDSTASKLASANGSASASATWNVHVEPLGARALGAALEQRRHVVGRRHLAAAARRGERRVAVAGGDVEHALVAAQVAGFGERLADDLQRGADDGVVAAGPGQLLAGLEGGEIDGCIHGVWLLWSIGVIARRWSCAKALCAPAPARRPARASRRPARSSVARPGAPLRCRRVRDCCPIVRPRRSRCRVALAPRVDTATIAPSSGWGDATMTTQAIARRCSA